MDPRHHKRIIIVQNLFSHTFTKDQANFMNAADEKTLKVIENEAKIDELIAKYAPKFPLDRIAKVDLSILRLAVYELIIEKTEPTKVIINEAVELAKQFGGEKSYAFVNAVLGMVVKQTADEEKKQA